MQQHNLAIIVPVHFPKIHNLENLYSSYLLINPDIDFYVVISEEELDKIELYKQIVPIEHIIVCPNVNSSQSPVTYKKMYGLNFLHNLGLYSGYATIDSECLFLKSGFKKSFENFYTKQEIICYPTDVNFLIDIQRKSAEIFSENEQLKLFKTQYSVWNTIPWFIDAHLNHYFKDIGGIEYFYNCEWMVFDQLNYQSWLISRDLFTISETQFRLEYPEDMPKQQRDDVFSNNCVDWIRYGSRHLKCMENQKPLMYFHVDRDEKSDQI